jgi:hypothetical protein
MPVTTSNVRCAVSNCGDAATFSLHLNDVYHGSERYYAPLDAAFCTRHALENEITAHGDLPGPRCYRIYTLIANRCDTALKLALHTTGWLTYRVLPMVTADADAKRAARLLPKKPRVPWAPVLPRDVVAMRRLLEKVGGGR